VTGSAAVLENPARWLGVIVAVVGAFLANPDATMHIGRTIWSGAQKTGRRARGMAARLIPALRKGATVHGVPMGGSAALGHVEATGRGMVAWGPDATVEHKIEILDQRTRSLDREVGELKRDLSQAEKRLRKELAGEVEQLHREASSIRAAVEKLRQDIARSDASALPIVVVGIVLTGLAPDIAGWWMWAALVLLLGAVVLAGWLSWRIVRDYRRETRAVGSAS
jgi:hypothetical protein